MGEIQTMSRVETATVVEGVMEGHPEEEVMVVMEKMELLQQEGEALAFR